MRLIRWLSVFMLLTLPAFSQESGGLSTRNPLDEIKDELKDLLSAASLPFTPDQERSIALVLEESRRASEQLFGDVMDFRDGPPQGERLDRAKAGIQWMNEEFSKRVRQYLTPEQLAVWDKHLAEKAAAAESSSGGTAGTSEQVQQIRINNNPFTTENQFYGGAWSGGSFGFANGGGVNTVIIQRGGVGAFHGSYEFRFRDESLNARNAFSSNKPPYQQRNFNANTSGPVIRNRLTLGIGASQSQQDNVGTIKAETESGPFELGFTRPAIFRNFWGNGTYQVNSGQSVDFGFNYGNNNRKKQGMGGFTLPERAFSASGNYRNINLRHVWFMSDRTVQDISFEAGQEKYQTTPATRGVAIDVLGSFSRGGYQNRNEGNAKYHSLRALWIDTGQRWTMRTGGSWNYNRNRELSENNYSGTFEFSSLAAYLAGAPTLYRVTQGNPELTVTQQEWSSFLQSELRASNRLTFFFGLRHEFQTNLEDSNNFDPRFSVAYALDNSTVVRGGVGVFHMRVENWITREWRRLDGASQYEILINNPSYPDPFLSGDVAITVVPPSSRRVLSEDFTAPYSVNSGLVIERSLPANLFVTASLDYHRAVHTLRARDLNAPLPGTPAGADGKIPRPDPSQGVVQQLESTGLGSWTALRLSMRQRFSIFNVNATYSIQTDENEGGGPFNSPSDSYNFRADLARMTRRQFNTGINSRLPFGVYLTTNININSGNPYSVTTGTDDNGDGVTNDRPAGERRNSRYGPGFRSVNFNISKSLTIGRNASGESTQSLNLFANMNNAFNTTNFWTPVNVITSKYFGQSLGANNPREIEVGLRFQF